MARVDHGLIYSLIKALFADLSRNGTIWPFGKARRFNKTVKKLLARGPGLSPIGCAATVTVALQIVVAREFFKKIISPRMFFMDTKRKPFKSMSPVNMCRFEICILAGGLSS